MSELKVDTVVDAAGTGKPNFSNGVTMNGAALSTLNLGEYTASSSEPSSPQNGSVWWDTTNEKIFIYIAGEWKETIGIAAFSWGGSRGLIAGGTYPVQNNIDYIAIQTTGNGTDFGDLTEPKEEAGAFSNGSRGFFASGYDGSIASVKIDYLTIGTLGNASDFGDCINARQYGCSSCCDGSRGIMAGLREDNPIEYITCDTLGNGTVFGDMSTNGRGSGSGNDATRGVFGGRDNNGTKTTTIDYITIQTTGNATDFGDCTARSNGCGVSDTTRVCFVAGRAPSGYTNSIEYVTTQTTGNATDFGDTSTTSGYQSGGMSDNTRGVYTMSNGGNNSNVIEYITIQTAGNGTDFGDCTTSYISKASTAGT